MVDMPPAESLVKIAPDVTVGGQQLEFGGWAAVGVVVVSRWWGGGCGCLSPCANLLLWIPTTLV